MQATCEAVNPDALPVKDGTLMAIALAAAMAGLTLLDVAPSPKAARHPASGSMACIVASAVFAGANTPIGAPAP